MPRMTLASFAEGLRRTEWLRLEHGLVVLAAALPVSIAATNFGVVLVVVLFLRDGWLRGIRPEPTSLDAFIVAWVLWTALSSITSFDPVESLRDLRNQGHWAVYFVTVTAIVRGADLRRLQNLWIAAAVVAASYGLLQTTVGLNLFGHGGGEATGFYSSHLAFGHLMAVTLGLVLARLGSAPHRRFERILLAGALGVLATGLVVSFGRGPWLAFLFVALGWMLWERRIALAAGAVALVLVAQLAWVGTRPGGLGSFYGSFSMIDPGTVGSVRRDEVASNAWRMTMWREGLRLVPLRPVLGTGPETVGELSPDFRTPFRDFGVAHLHSNYFEILVTRGFVGLGLLITLLLAATRLLSRAGAAIDDTVGRSALFAGLSGVLVHAVHGQTYFTVGNGILQPGFIFLLGLAVGVLRRGGADDLPRRPRRETFLWAGVTVAVAVVLVETPGPGLWSVFLASASAVDLVRRVIRGTANLPAVALGLAFAFVVVAGLVLLLPTAGGWIAVGRVVEAASVPFAVVYGSLLGAEGRLLLLNRHEGG